MAALTVFYMLETPYHLRVATDDGRERWVAKYKLTNFRIDDCDVHLSFKPKFECEAVTFAPPPKRTERKCPRCERSFLAKAQYRYCDPCKETDVWVFANQSFDR